MGAAFVKRRMQAELGPDWQSRFGSFDLRPSAAASLGQVHRATEKSGAALACKLQYPDMASAVEADIRQLEILLSVHRRMSPGIDTREIVKEVSERVREELDYAREAKHAALYRHMLAEVPEVHVPTVRPDLSTTRLLTMEWLEGRKLLEFTKDDLDTRNRIAVAMFKAWWVPFCHYGVIHGDPHLGNYTIHETGGSASGVNLLDYGCIRIFPPKFVAAVVNLYRGLLDGDADRVQRAYDTWGFKGLKPELIESLNIWARFIYGPILDNRVRTVADGVAPGHYGRREAFQVHKILKEKGPITIPREFVFMDRAAVGLGSVFLHLGAEMNFARLFQDTIADFDEDVVAERQSKALEAAGLK
jgi:predicted unusual protein kinase regulating ubiquinone biosynthesis (AarF/ABC1/UbiB family)